MVNEEKTILDEVGIEIEDGIDYEDEEPSEVIDYE